MGDVGSFDDGAKSGLPPGAVPPGRLSLFRQRSEPKPWAKVTRWVVPGSRLLSHFPVAPALGGILRGPVKRTKAAPLQVRFHHRDWLSAMERASGEVRPAVLAAGLGCFLKKIRRDVDPINLPTKPF